MFGVYLPKKPKRVLLLGSGALKIGQAGEFDYSGAQAIKALREEGIKTILVNPNIATVQTSAGLADRVYLHAVVPELLERVIVKEEVDGILLGFGGQTALNAGLALDASGVLSKYGVRVLGTPIKAIRDTEDRELFIERLREIRVKTARSRACRSRAAAEEAIREIGLPAMLRSGFSLGGLGSAVVRTEAEVHAAVDRAFRSSDQVLVEEYLSGWKEIEYEVVRDWRDNCITVCNMENLDPMGIHTGDSIVVAPSQTLTDAEYQELRSVALRTVRHLGIVGECNIQYALDPKTSDYRVIEVNARLSRSSALASKATGYPLAYVAAKLAVGYALPDIPNCVTRRTSAFFEPALDYIVCKFPRWDFGKFKGTSTEIGPEMKSIGEVMAIGRTFPEVLQKAVRMLDIGVRGLDPDAGVVEGAPPDAWKRPTPSRLFAICRALRDGTSIDEIHAVTHIDRWFLHHIAEIASAHRELKRRSFTLDEAGLRRAKQLGFSDQAIDELTGEQAGSTRRLRKALNVNPHLAKVDTLAAEFPAETNYMYSTYHASRSETEASSRKKVMVLGSGTYRIGSSVEFDWCCVNAATAASELGFETIMLNYNPETVSTDYDMCDKLVFDEISLESVLELYEREKPDGVIVSMGGQIPNNLAIRLFRAGVTVLGTSPQNIDRAEDRRKFSVLLDELGIEQPKWAHVTEIAEASTIVDKLGGYPVLVRPSYVLSGAAMSVAHEPNELLRILERAKRVSPEHPVVVTAFETHAREIEIDAVADHGELVLWAISEHVEDAGVHSGDATLLLPPQTISIPTVHKARKIAEALARALEITGPFNLQMLAKNNTVRVIECNLRASRSFPFVSKVTGNNFVREATRLMLGARSEVRNRSLDLDYVAAKVPQFSFARLVGADPMLGVEMASTGEVGCFGDDAHEALLHALLATGFRFPTKGVLLSLGPIEEKFSFVDEARTLADVLELPIFATEGTARMLSEVGIPCTLLSKQAPESQRFPTHGHARGGVERDAPVDGVAAIDQGLVDLVINIPREYDELGRPDGYHIRRRAVDAGVSLVTDLELARALVEALRRKRKPADLDLLAWSDYLARRPVALR